MGIDYKAAIMVGLPRGEILEQDLLDEEDELEVCPAYYDGDGDDDAIAGLRYKSSPDYQACVLEWDQAEVDALKAAFKRITGQEAKVWLSPRGY